jgi:hypothetical protein
MPLTPAFSRRSQKSSACGSLFASAPRRRRRAQIRWRGRLQLESLECRCLLAGDDPGGDLPPIDPPWGIVSGLKWEDLDGNGRRDEGEPGLPGVTVYADLNWNGILDADEPSTVTEQDSPETDFDESGLYLLDEVPAGTQSIREVVPAGFVQTYPGPTDWDWRVEPQDEGTAHVDPPVVELAIHPGQTVHQQVSIRIEPFCIRPVPIDVVANDPAVKLENRSGVQLNGCGGDVSHFDLAVSVEQTPLKFEIQFIDSEGNSVLATIPAYVLPAPHSDGGHVVEIVPGGGVGDIDFGNSQVPGGAIEGYKWLDTNADGQWDADEKGLGGIIIYVDFNANGQWDRDEPSAVTEYENPDTDFDEGGRFYLSGLRAGEHLVRELLPPGFVQTFPAPGAAVHDSETGRMNEGIALDLDVTGISVAPGQQAGLLDAQLDVTVVWPDSCGTLIDADMAFTVVGQHILVELAGHQVGQACAEVISPQQASLQIPGLAAGRFRYHVVATLHESVPGGDADLPTLTAVAQVKLGEDGAHRVTLGDDELVSGIHFGNYGRIPDPPDDVWVAADLDRDGVLDARDLDLLASAVRDGSSEAGATDLSGDGRLDHQDVEYVVRNLLNTHFGDANLDGRFDSSDLVQIFQRGQYEDHVAGNSGWADGDWNGDGEFDSSDLVFAMQHGGYELVSAASRRPSG